MIIIKLIKPETSWPNHVQVYETSPVPGNKTGVIRGYLWKTSYELEIAGFSRNIFKYSVLL